MAVDAFLLLISGQTCTPCFGKKLLMLFFILLPVAIVHGKKSNDIVVIHQQQ